jgi:hypothetical protein
MLKLPVMSLFILSLLKSQFTMMGAVFFSFSMAMNRIEVEIEGAQLGIEPLEVKPAEAEQDDDE